MQHGGVPLRELLFPPPPPLPARPRDPGDRMPHGGVPLRELLLPPPRRLRRPDRPLRRVQADPVRRRLHGRERLPQHPARLPPRPYHPPLAYLPALTDPGYLERYRRSRIVVCVGQGAWEDDMLADTRELQAILEGKGIPARIDYWGHDVNHDWPWWRLQMPYFLEHMNL